MKRIVKLLGLTLLIIITGCQTFDDGGLVTKADKRILNEWKLQTYLLDGVNSTNSLRISNLTETYFEDGTYQRSYDDKDGLFFTEEGRFTLPDKETIIEISGVSSLELSDLHSTVSSDHYNITRMKNDEFWYSYDNGGATHEFRFVLK